METHDEEQKLTCAQCRRELREGEDAFAFQEGVIGLRGFVPLEDLGFLCSEACRREYFDMSSESAVHLPRRVP